jgi:hypothetical protein
MYGLYAEEVARVYPELVSYGEDGEPHSVAYQRLPAVLFKAMQKQARETQEQAAQIATLQEQIVTQQKQIRTLQKETARIDTLIARLGLLSDSQGRGGALSGC